MDIKKNASGNIVISPEVVEKIAKTAATDVTGVFDVVPRTQNFKSMIKSRKVSKAVNCTIRDGQYIIDIYLKVNEGVKLTELATKVQKNIKEAVQNMTGTVVTKINVHVCEVQFKSAEENKD